MERERLSLDLYHCWVFTDGKTTESSEKSFYEGGLREGRLYILCSPVRQVSHTCCSPHETSHTFPPNEIICLFAHLCVSNVSSGFHGFPGLNGLNGLPGTKGSPGTPGKGNVQ